MFDIRHYAGSEFVGRLVEISITGRNNCIGIGLLVRKKRTKEKIEEVYKTPIERATSLLNSLEKERALAKGEVKEYYSELTDISKLY
jgi:hypothetical protein